MFSVLTRLSSVLTRSSRSGRGGQKARAAVAALEVVGSKATRRLLDIGLPNVGSTMRCAIAAISEANWREIKR